MILEAVGPDAARALQGLVGGSHIELPRAAGVERLLRDNAPRAGFDAGEPVNVLSYRHRVIGRYVRRLLKVPLAGDALRCAPGWEHDLIGGLLAQFGAHVKPLPGQHHSQQATAVPFPAWAYVRSRKIAQGYLPGGLMQLGRLESGLRGEPELMPMAISCGWRPYLAIGTRVLLPSIAR